MRSRKPLSTKNTWYNIGRWGGDAFLWLARKFKPERSSGNEDLDRINDLILETATNEATQEGIRELNRDTSSWDRFDYFDPNHPQQGVYGGRYAYNPAHNTSLPSNSMSSGIADAFMRGLRHEDINGNFRFQDLQTGNIVLFTKNDLPFSAPLPSFAGKKILPSQAAAIAIQAMQGSPKSAAPIGSIGRPQTYSIPTTIPQAHMANAPIAMSARPTAIPIISYEPQAHSAAPPIAHVAAPRYHPYVISRGPRERPNLSAEYGGPIRKSTRRMARAVAQPEPFDYVGYLTDLSNLKFTF